MRYFYTDNSALTYFTAGNLVSRDGFLHHRRIMDCNVLIFVLDGTLHITQGNEEFDVAAGEYILLNAGEEHFGHLPSSGRLSYLWAHFSLSKPFDILNGGADAAPPEGFAYVLAEKRAAASVQRAEMLFRQLIDFSMHGALYTSRMTECALSLLLMELSQELIDTSCGERRSISPVVYEVREWIKSNCHRHGLTAGAIAEEFHYSREYLAALFRKETGLTITEFLNRSRIDVTKNLLASNNISIKEAAYSGGFSDEKYYMRVFKRHEGITPQQYKNAFGGC